MINLNNKNKHCQQRQYNTMKNEILDMHNIISDNQKLTGLPNYKTNFIPFVSQPSHNFTFWSNNKPFTTLNENSSFDYKRAGFKYHRSNLVNKPLVEQGLYKKKIYAGCIPEENDKEFYEPIHNNLGVSFIRSFHDKNNSDKYSDPSIFDARSFGYSSNDRYFFNKNSETIDYVYNDIDNVRQDNSITYRNRVDVLMPYNINSLEKSKLFLHNEWINNTNNFREELSSLLMRKNNAINEYQKKFPITKQLQVK
jgi:hypothetical protein